LAERNQEGEAMGKQAQAGKRKCEIVLLRGKKRGMEDGGTFDGRLAREHC
jgi:hypothetical protein